jgi:hypothetical protein
MKSSEMINKIRTLLDIQVKLEERKLENGTVVEAESFEKGKEIFIKTDDEKVAMPVGEYILESGELVVVEEEGIIADVREVSDEVPQKEEESKDETEDLEEKEMEEDEYEEEMPDWYKKTYEEMKSRVQNLEDAIADIKAGKLSEDVQEKELSEEKVEENIESEVKEELSEEKEVENSELKEELSKPATEPIKHSPEAKSSTVEKTIFSKRKSHSIMDTILSKINNN